MIQIWNFFLIWYASKSSMGKKSMGEASKGAFPREYGEKLLRFADSFNKVFFHCLVDYSKQTFG